MTFMFCLQSYSCIILRSHAWFGVLNTHSALLPLPRSTEHSSLHMYNPHSSFVQYLCSRHHARRFATFASVNNGLRLARQLVMPYWLKIDLIVVRLIDRSQARMSSAYESFGCSRTLRMILRIVASEYS